MPIARLALAAAVLMTTAAHAGGWKTYANERFGAAADYPSGWKMGPEPENNDGRWFASPDGRAKVIISGNFALETREAEMDQRAQPGNGETITYLKKGEDWIVASGKRANGKIFYRKSLLSCGDQVWNNLDIEYPADDKAKYDRLVAHMAASLRAGVGYNITCK